MIVYDDYGDKGISIEGLTVALSAVLSVDYFDAMAIAENIFEYADPTPPPFIGPPRPPDPNSKLISEVYGPQVIAQLEKGSICLKTIRSQYGVSSD